MPWGVGSQVSRSASIGPRLGPGLAVSGPGGGDRHFGGSSRVSARLSGGVADLEPDERAPVFLAPLSRAAGVVLIRRLLAICYESYPADQRPDLSLIGVHSAKVTFLSLAKQLLLDEALRREQGHHRRRRVTP
ncbi:unnamed protein product [Symbiodinium sp. CCMP2592]|nr:unnamed protein product [Symbiodinium sp. CCMP2592]